MIWKEVKSWAIKNGYKVDRLRISEEKNKYEYRWVKNDQEGVEYSMSTFVRTIYNQMTNNAYVSHQESYVPMDLKNAIQN